MLGHTESQPVITVQKESKVDKSVTANLSGYCGVTLFMSQWKQTQCRTIDSTSLLMSSVDATQLYTPAYLFFSFLSLTSNAFSTIVQLPFSSPARQVWFHLLHCTWRKQRKYNVKDCRIQKWFLMAKKMFLRVPWERFRINGYCKMTKTILQALSFMIRGKRETETTNMKTKQNPKSTDISTP